MRVKITGPKKGLKWSIFSNDFTYMKDEFIACGLNATEYDVFVHLLGRGRRAAGHIAKALNLKRSTVYSALQGLEARKLVTRSTNKGTAEFVPVPVEEVSSILLNRARADFEKVAASIELIKPRIEKYRGWRTIEAGALGIRSINSAEEYYEVLTGYILNRDFCAVWNPQVALYSKEIQDWVTRFLEKTGKRKSSIKDIVVNGPMTDWYAHRITNPNHKVRQVAQERQSVADLVIVDDVVLISLMSPESESALEIRNKQFADFSRWYFMLLWERLE